SSGISSPSMSLILPALGGLFFVFAVIFGIVEKPICASTGGGGLTVGACITKEGISSRLTHPVISIRGACKHRLTTAISRASPKVMTGSRPSLASLKERYLVHIPLTAVRRMVEHVVITASPKLGLHNAIDRAGFSSGSLDISGGNGSPTGVRYIVNSFSVA